MPSVLEPYIEAALQLVPDLERIVVGFSGGLDSTVLLHMAALHATCRRIPIVALHIHHGISPSADDWSAQCRSRAEALSVEFIEERVELGKRTGSVEAQARTLRYQAFRRHLRTGDVLLLGHHANDQIETVLMRLLRGVDPALLASIPETRMIGHARLLRPLLSLKRSQLEDYASRHHLRWVEDESNADLSIRRNELRHRVLPLLVEKDDGVTDALLSLSLQHSRMNHLLSRLYLVSKDRFVEELVSGIGLRVDRLRVLSREAQRLLVRQWIADSGLPQPGCRIFDRVWSEVLPAQPDARPELNWGACYLRRYGAWLFLVSAKQDVGIESEFEVTSVQGAHNGDCIYTLESSSVASLQGSETGVIAVTEGRVAIKRFDALPARQKFMGRTKKDWCRRLGIAYWDQRRIFQVESGGEVVALCDAQTLTVVAQKDIPHPQAWLRVRATK